MSFDRVRIKVALAEMNAREKSMLEFFFTNKLDHKVELADQGVADVVVFDLDCPGAPAQWRTYINAKTGFSLAMSCRKPEQESEQSIWIEKPLSSAHIVAALDKVAKSLGNSRIRADVRPPEDAAILKIENINPAKRSTDDRSSNTERTSSAQKSQSQSSKSPNHPRIRGINILALNATEEDLCGTREDVDLNDQGRCIALYYIVANYYQHSVEKAYRLSMKERKPVLLTVLGEKVAFFPNDNEISTTINEDTLLDICTYKIRSDQVAIKILTDEEAHYYHIKRKITTSYVLQADAFIWLVALLSSRGRVPKGIDMNQKVVLRRWPNLTRMVQTPDALRIAALWSTKRITLSNTPKRLGIPQRRVFAFFSAAYSLGLLKLNDQTSRQPNHPVEKSDEGTLFSRLLSRLPADGRNAA